jgi:hypothetical protein
MSVESTDPVRSYASIFKNTGFFKSASGFSASGGTQVISGGYTYHVFTTSGALEVEGNGNAEVLIVAGGGSGGGIYYAGGGGAGGVIHGSTVALTAGSYSISIGSGGATPTGASQKYDGADTTFGTVTAIGGGSGGSYSSTGSGNAGGSSGGNSGYIGAPSTAKTPQPVPGDYTAYGNNGGYGFPYGGGGGGGAGGVGSNSNSSTGAPGGNGQPFPGFPAPAIAPAIPAPVRSDWTTAVGPTGLFGGGGGGANYYTTAGRSTGGPGGGGKGQGTYPNPSLNAEPGIEYTGGGGGGSNYNPGDGGGGDGIVIVKYAT